ncbi:acylphosphatase-2 [Zeugodacus cucurbitae]|uniref:acylphosphatase-2 n=1 Tax=Zeugodacus cucurbitae TaxID=28588 RepID=UPI0005968CDD|nr:acylphosphatase-2 [Zeugodacus cucurbitae]
MAANKFFGSIELRFINFLLGAILFCVVYKPHSVIGSKNTLIEMSAKQIFSTDFEIFGKVQGVFFRKHTEKQAKLFGLRGWCMNTSQGTVRGQMEGELNKVNEMKYWLQTKGSPKSRIDKAVFSETKEIPDYTFKAFTIKR